MRTTTGFDTDDTICVQSTATAQKLGIFLGAVTLETLPLFIKENTLVWSNCYARSDHCNRRGSPCASCAPAPATR